MTRALAPAPPESGLRPVTGNFGVPGLGYGRQYIRGPLALWRKRYEQLGPVSWFGAFGMRNVVLLGPDACAAALVNADKAFANGPGWRLFIGPFFERGLMLLDGDEHRGHRRIMQEAFTSQRLARYVEALNPAIATGLAAGRRAPPSAPIRPSSRSPWTWPPASSWVAPRALIRLGWPR